MICSIYARQDGTIAHIDDGIFAITPDPDTTLVIQFAIDSYPTEYQHIADNSKAAFWDGANLQIDNVVYLDSAWIAARQAELTQAGNDATEDSSARDTLLDLAASALTQIAADRAAIASGKTALANAATLAAVKPIVDGMLDRLDNVCNRQDREIRALRAVIRNGLGSG